MPKERAMQIFLRLAIRSNGNLIKLFIKFFWLLEGCFRLLGGFTLVLLQICLSQECQITQKYDSFSFKEQLQPPKIVLVLAHKGLTFIMIFHRQCFLPSFIRSIEKRGIQLGTVSQGLTARCFLPGLVRKTETMIRCLKCVSNTYLRLVLISGYVLSQVCRRKLQCLAEDILYSFFLFSLYFIQKKNKFKL